MSEYIVSVPDKEAELFIARFGIDGTRIFGHQLVGEIVRCRDCKWFDRIASGGVCVRYGYFSIYTTGDGFCSKAKRRDA